MNMQSKPDSLAETQKPSLLKRESGNNRDIGERRHARDIQRLQIAKTTIWIFSVLIGVIIVSVFLYARFINPEFTTEAFTYIMGSIASSIFGIITLVLGFVAGSAIDK